jgi:hypothetical protein
MFTRGLQQQINIKRSVTGSFGAGSELVLQLDIDLIAV